MDDARTSEDEKVLNSPRAPLEVANQFVVDHCHIEGALTLRRWRGGWWTWRKTHWAQCPADELRRRLYAFTKDACYVTAKGEKAQWMPDKTKINMLLDALAASACHTDDALEPPCWVDGRTAAGTIVACRNGLLDARTGIVADHTPLFFNTMSLPFDYDPDAPDPGEWLKFLKELWPDDPASIQTLRQIFGCIVSGRTDFQKIFALIGPTRGGKGVMSRVLSSMIGDRNVIGPTLASLSERFGLAPLIGKSLAVVADARIAGRNVQTLVERLLSISGEDKITVDIKYDPVGWTGRMPARILLLSNELPQLGDASGAIVGRFVLLTLTKSWLGKEDIGLETRMLAELPGILNWSLDGMDDLEEHGHFTQPETGANALLQMAALSSPVGAFVRERCEVGANFEARTDEMYREYKHWALAKGLREIADNIFGKNLRAAVPGVDVSRARDGDDRFNVYTGLRLRSGFGRGLVPAEAGARRALEDLKRVVITGGRR
jgi:putative DNA primase/helicase